MCYRDKIDFLISSLGRPSFDVYGSDGQLRERQPFVAEVRQLCPVVGSETRCSVLTCAASVLAGHGPPADAVSFDLVLAGAFPAVHPVLRALRDTNAADLEPKLP